jgi:hypothetical protein
LWNLIAGAGGVTTTSAKNDILSKHVIATGSDGYKALFSAGEIDPMFGNQPVLVAYADTAGQLGPHGSDGLARMVAPSDQAGGRYVSNLTSLQVIDATATHSVLFGLGRRVAHAHQVHRFHAHDHLPVLVQDLQQGVNQAAVGLGT